MAADNVTCQPECRSIEGVLGKQEYITNSIHVLFFCQLTPQNSGRYDIYSGKRQHIYLTNSVNGTSIHIQYVRYVSGGVTKD